jgi:hypothetical protein
MHYSMKEEGSGSMKSSESVVREVAWRSFVSVVICTLFAYIFWQGLVFHRHHTVFLCIAYGTIGSLFFYTLRYSLRNALGTLLVSTMAFSFLVMRSSGLRSLRDVLLAIAAAGVLYLYFKIFYRQTQQQRYLEPLILAMLFAVGNCIVFIIMTCLYGLGSHITFWWAFDVLKQWFIIGLGIGIGILLTEEPTWRKIRAWFHGL